MRHRGSAACRRRVSEINAVSLATPMPEILGVDAARLRKLKVLALGRWRYTYKLSHNAVSAINEDAQRHTEQVLEAYLQHLPRVLASNGLCMDTSTTAQLNSVAQTAGIARRNQSSSLWTSMLSVIRAWMLSVIELIV